MRSHLEQPTPISPREITLEIRSTQDGEWQVIYERGNESLARFKHRDDALSYALQLAQREQQARVDIYRGDGRLVSSDHYRQHRH